MSSTTTLTTSHHQHNILDVAVHEAFVGAGEPWQYTDLFLPFNDDDDTATAAACLLPAPAMPAQSAIAISETTVTSPPTDFLSQLTAAEQQQQQPSFQNIQTEIIDDRFCFAQYLSFKVIMMRTNGYVNATTLVKTFSDAKKQYRFWLQNASTKTLIARFVESSSISQWHIKVTGGVNLQTRGSYVHPLLISSLMSWLSPSHALLINILTNRIVFQYHTGQNQILDNLSHHADWNNMCHDVSIAAAAQPVIKQRNQRCAIEVYKKHSDDSKFPYFYAVFIEQEEEGRGFPTAQSSARERKIRKLLLNHYPKSEFIYRVVNTSESEFRRFLKSHKLDYSHRNLAATSGDGDNLVDIVKRNSM